LIMSKLKTQFSAHSGRLRQTSVALVRDYQPPMFFLVTESRRLAATWKERKESMKLLVASVVALGLSFLGFSFAAMTASQAMPLAPLDQAASADTIRVAGGCGPGWHRGPYGGCRPMFNCPPGWHSGPFGRRRFRNW
jgi:hypothetical protein